MPAGAGELEAVLAQGRDQRPEEGVGIGRGRQPFDVALHPLGLGDGGHPQMIAQRPRPENPRSLGLCGGRTGARLRRMNTSAAVFNATVNHDGEGEELLIRGTRILVKAATPAVTVTDHTIPAGFPGPPLHVHPALDEAFLVLEGTLSSASAIGSRRSARWHRLRPGAAPHTFANAAEAPARFMVADPRRLRGVLQGDGRWGRGGGPRRRRAAATRRSRAP